MKSLPNHTWPLRDLLDLTEAVIHPRLVLKVVRGIAQIWAEPILEAHVYDVEG